MNGHRLRVVISCVALAVLCLGGCAADRAGLAEAVERIGVATQPPRWSGEARAGAIVPAPATHSGEDGASTREALDPPAIDTPPAGGEDAAIEGNEGEEEETQAQMWEVLGKTFGRRGEVKDGVYRLVTPRADLFVTMDGRDVPAGAFLESDFRFWRCPCGKLLVNGQFALADYEANDVVDELQEGGLDVVTIAPLLLHEHPRLVMVRFQGEGRTRAMAEALKSALDYTGDARNAPQPMDLSPEPGP